MVAVGRLDPDQVQDQQGEDVAAADLPAEDVRGAPAALLARRRLLALGGAGGLRDGFAKRL